MNTSSFYSRSLSVQFVVDKTHHSLKASTHNNATRRNDDDDGLRRRCCECDDDGDLRKEEWDDEENWYSHEQGCPAGIEKPTPLAFTGRGVEQQRRRNPHRKLLRVLKARFVSVPKSFAKVKEQGEEEPGERYHREG